MKQTAVEWLYDEMKHIIPNDFLNKFEQAKEKEKEQIEDAYKDGFRDGAGMSEEFKVEYYNQTYLKESK